MINLEHRSYGSGKFYRPKPIIIERPESHLTLVLTCWGPQEAVDKTGQFFIEQFEAMTTEDQASPYELFPTLSPIANKLRVAMLATNQFVYKQENNKIWRVAFECLALHWYQGVFSWSSVGSPHVFLKNSESSHPLSYGVDFGLQQDGQGPLFTNALGLETNVPISVGSIRAPKDSSVILISRDTIPLGAMESATGLSDFYQQLVKNNVASPFWVATAKLTDEPDFKALDGAS